MRTAATCSSSSSSSSSSSHFSRRRRRRRHHRVEFPRRSFSAARRTENGICDDKDEDDKSFEKFVTIRSNDGVVALGYDKKTRVRGLFATREIKNETEIFRVSLRKEDESVFADDKDDDDDDDSSSSSFFKGGDWSASLAKQILKKKKMKKRTSGTDEEDEDEELKTAYVHALPKEIIGIANKCCCFYDGADELVCAFFEATGDHDAKEELMKYRKQISSSRSPRVEEKAEEEDEYGWALSQVFSRTFRIEDVRGRRAPRRVMIPIVDLLNHSSVEEEVNVTWRVTEDLSAFIVEAKRDVGKDEELILSYGERNDQHFLLFYGFLPSANPCNSVVLWEDVDECLNWYQNLCGADENDAKWDAMKYKCKRTLGLLKKKDEGDFIDDINEERRRFILSPNAKVDNTTLLVLNEISGDNDMAVAAVRVRAEEILSQRFASENDANVERIFKQLIEETHMDEADIGLLRAYRNRKRDILREIV